MRWAIRTRHLDGTPVLLPGRHDSRDEAAARVARLRAAHPEHAYYRLVRLVTRSERLQRELDEARAAIGEAWFRDEAMTLAEAIRRKTSALERVAASRRPP